MKKAFKSSTVQDQQVVSKSSIPNPVADIYNQSDKPPPLSILTPYRYGFVHPQSLFSVNKLREASSAVKIAFQTLRMITVVLATVKLVIYRIAEV